MLDFLSTVVWGVLLASTGHAAALPALQTRAVTPLSSVDLSALAPFTHFAGAAYCGLDTITAWSCSTILIQGYYHMRDTNSNMCA